MQKTRLLVTASTFPRWKDDTEPRFVLDLCKSLTKYASVTALVPAAPGALSRENLEGVDVIRYHYFPIHSWETLCYPGAIVPRIKEKKIRILLVPFLFISLFFNMIKLKKHYDVLHAHWLIPQGIVAAFTGIPYLVTGHGGDVGELNKHIFHLLKARCIRKAMGVTLVSAHLKTILEEKYSYHDAKVLSMGCDTSLFSPASEDTVTSRLTLPESKRTILFVGRLAEKKGVEYLIRAMQGTTCRLLIVGGGPLEADLKALSSRLSLDSRIEFTGPKTHEQLVSIYQQADIFCAPSITAKNGDVEGFGLVILEAMASGLPVIASNSGGIPDIITDGNNGILTPERDEDALAQAINLLLTDREKYMLFSSKSVETAARFSYDSIAAKYAELLKLK